MKAFSLSSTAWTSSSHVEASLLRKTRPHINNMLYQLSEASGFRKKCRCFFFVRTKTYSSVFMSFFRSLLLIPLFRKGGKKSQGTPQTLSRIAVFSSTTMKRNYSLNDNNNNKKFILWGRFVRETPWVLWEKQKQLQNLTMLCVGNRYSKRG